MTLPFEALAVCLVHAVVHTLVVWLCFFWWLQYFCKWPVLCYWTRSIGFSQQLSAVLQSLNLLLYKKWHSYKRVLQIFLKVTVIQGNVYYVSMCYLHWYFTLKKVWKQLIVLPTLTFGSPKNSLPTHGPQNILVPLSVLYC